MCIFQVSVLVNDLDKNIIIGIIRIINPINSKVLLTTLKRITRVAQKSGNLPVSRFPIITPSPNLAFFQIEVDGITPLCSSPMNSHDRVVCSFLPLFTNTDNTLGCPTSKFGQKGYTLNERKEAQRIAK